MRTGESYSKMSPLCIAMEMSASKKKEDWLFGEMKYYLYTNTDFISIVIKLADGSNQILAGKGACWQFNGHRG